MRMDYLLECLTFTKLQTILFVFKYVWVFDCLIFGPLASNVPRPNVFYALVHLTQGSTQNHATYCRYLKLLLRIRFCRIGRRGILVAPCHLLMSTQ